MVSGSNPSYISEEGERLVVFGSNFPNLGLLRCSFGSIPIQQSNAVFINSSAVSCTVPQLQNPNAWISLDVSLNGANDGSNDLPYLLRYIPPPVVISVSPLAAGQSGGTMTTVLGQGFDRLHEIWCSYLGVASTPATILSSTTAQCRVPASLRLESFQTSLQVVLVRSTHTVLATFDFTVIDHIRIAALYPQLGLIAGGYNMTVSTHSTGLLRTPSFVSLSCVIGRFRVKAYAVNDSSIVCAVPAVGKPVSVRISVVVNGNEDDADSTAYFTYMSAIQLKNATPARSPVAGNASIVIETEDAVFAGISCLFGSISVPGTVLSETKIRCVSPPHAEKLVPVRLAVDGATVVSENVLLIEFYIPPDAYSVIPSSGILHNKSIVTITGSNFGAVIHVDCVFQDTTSGPPSLPIVVSGSLMSETQVDCTVPSFSRSVSSVAISVVVDSITAVRDQAFTFVGELRILSMSPLVGFAQGGTEVRITLDSSSPVNVSYTCRFGYSTVPATRAANSSVVACVSPPAGASDTCSLQVSANGVDFFSSANASELIFRYIPDPAISHYTPTLGSSKGGTQIVLQGEDFQNDTIFECVFNGITRTAAEVINSTAIACRTPPDTDNRGEASVALSDRSATFMLQLAPPFVYMNEIQVVSVYPRTIPANFNQNLQVAGSNFPQTDKLQCIFGEANVSSSATRISSSLLICDPPDQLGLAGGNRNSSVAISWNGQDWGNTFPLSILEPFHLKSAFPLMLSSTRNTDVAVSGSGFDSDSSLVCVFNEISVPAAYVNRTRASCRAPYFHQTATVKLQLSSFDGFFADESIDMKVIPAPVLVSAEPRSALTSGQSVVQVRHANVSEGLQARCCFSSTLCGSGTRQNSTHLTCTTPATQSGTTIMQLAFGNSLIGWVRSTEAAFQFVEPPIVYNVVPRKQIYSANAVLSLTGRNFADSSDLSCLLRFSSRDQLIPARWKSSSLMVCVITKSDAKVATTESAEVLIRVSSIELVSTGFNVTFFAEPELRAVVPLAPPSGFAEQLITLVGYDFNPQVDVFCRFSRELASFSVAAHWLNSSMLSCPMPLWSAKDRAVVNLWTKLAGIVDQGGSIFSVDIPSRIVPWRISPNYGSLSGGTELNIVVNQQNLDQGNWSCCFNQTLYSPVRIRDSSVMTCITPSNELDGVVSVELVNEDESTLYLEKNWFYYTIAPKVLSVYPAQSSSRGGEQISIHGFGFSSMQSFKCRFGLELVDAVYEFDNRIYCVAPPQPNVAMDSQLPLEFFGADSLSTELIAIESDDTLTFSYVVVPELWNATVSSTILTKDGGDLSRLSFLIKGEGFVNVSTLVCGIEGERVIATLTDSNSIKCVMLTTSNADNVFRVTVSNDGVLFSGPILVQLNVSDFLQLLPLVPSLGSVRGGNAASSATCSSPLRFSSRNASFSLAIDTGGEQVESGLQYEFADGPRVSSVVPQVLVFGNSFPTTLSIYGSNFAVGRYPTCHFGNFFKTLGVPVNSTFVKCPVLNLPPVNHSMVEFSLGYENDEGGLFGASVERNGFAYVEFMKPSVLERIWPQKVAVGVQLAQPFEIRGHFFFQSQRVVCQFSCNSGKLVSTSQATFISQDVIACEAVPSFAAMGVCEVSLMQGNTLISEQQVTVTVANFIQVRKLTPSFGSAIGGSLVKVDGAGFSHESRPLCHFSRDMSVGGLVASTTTVYCTSPPMLRLNMTQDIDFWMSDGGMESTSLLFTYVAPARLTAISPKFGAAMQGTGISILGENFSPRFTYQCIFDGETAVPALFTNSTTLTCAPPSLKLGRHTLGLLVNGVDEVRNDFATFTSVPSVVLHRVDPVKGSLSRTGTVTTVVHGANFIDSKYLKCSFDGVESRATFLSSSEVECAVPYMPSGVMRVCIANNGLDFVAAVPPVVVSYEVLPNFAIDHIFPQMGPLSGGTIVQVFGVFSLLDELECVFGDQRVMARAFKVSQLSCIAPATLRTGDVKLAVQIANTSADSRDDGASVFTYLPNPTVSRVLPSIVSQSMQLVQITIQGEALNSLQVAGCRFSGITASLLSALSTEIKCSLNASLTGTFTVELLTSASIWTTLQTHTRIRVIRAVQPRLAYPSRFDERGGAQLLITAHNLYSAALSVRCRFGDIIVDGLVMSETILRCVTPSLVPGNVKLRISQDNISWSDTGLDVWAFASPVLFHVSPKDGFASAGSEITVFGTNFKQFPETSCRFDNKEVLATRVNESVIACRIPMLTAGGKSVSLRVSLNGFEVSANTLNVTIYEQPQTSCVQSTFEQLPNKNRVAANTSSSLFVGGDNFECLFNEQIHERMLLNSSVQAISCSDLRFPNDSPWSMAELLKNGRRLLEERIENRFDCPALISSVSTQTILASRVESITVSGFRFGLNVNISCRVGDTIIQGKVTSERTMDCQIPGKPSGNYSLDVLCGANDEVVATFTLEYQPLLFVHEFSPQVFPAVRENYVVEISGRHFTPMDRVVCRFGADDVVISAAEYVSSTKLRCMTPNVVSMKEIRFAVFVTTREGGEQRTMLIEDTIRFVNSPTSVALSPAFGSTMGLFTVSLHGTGLEDFQPGRCKFVGDIQEFESIEATGGTSELSAAFKCAVPSLDVGEYTVYITPNGRDYVSTSAVFTAHSHVQLVQVEPSAAGSYGGTTLTVTGSGFERWMKLACGFRASSAVQWVSVPATFKSPTTLECTSPRHQMGNTSFQLLPESSLSPGIQEISFRFTSEAVIRSISPQVVCVDGSTDIDVVGQGFFFSPKLQCRFHDVVRSGTFVNSSLVRCRAPPFAPSVVPLQLSLDGVTVLEQTVSVSYMAEPKIDSVNLTQELFGENNTAVVITGRNLMKNGNLTCEFDLSSGLPFDAKWHSPAMTRQDGKVGCSVPDLVPTGSVIVRLAQSSHNMVSNVVLFDHVASFVVQSISPTSGSMDGGYRISIRGPRFPAVRPVKCVFGNQEVTGESGSPYEIKCVVPRATNQRNPAIALQFGASQLLFSTNFTFAYHPRAEIHHIRPAFGWTRGGATVTVSGSRLAFEAALECVFGEIVVPATYVSLQKVVCESPVVTSDQRAPFSVRANGVELYSSVDLPFSIFETPMIRSLEPSVGSVDGGTNVALHGNLSAMVTRSQQLYCSFGDNGFAIATVMNASVVICTSPPFQQQQVAPLGLFYNIEDIALTGFSFRYASTAQVFSITPTRVPERWGGLVSVNGLGFFQSARAFCVFGQAVAMRSILRFVTSELVQCAVPRLVPGRYALQVSLNDEDIISTGKFLTVTKMSAVIDMSPRVDFVTGGAVVEFTGVDLAFVPSLSCLFGLKRTPAKFQDDKIRCTAPNASSPTVDYERVNVSLVSEGAPYTQQAFVFDYVQPPLITSLETTPLKPGVKKTLVLCGQFPGTASQVFSKFIGVDDEESNVMSVTGVQWNSSCQSFEIPETGDNCVQGCDVFVSVNNQSFAFSGKRVVLGLEPQVTQIQPRYGSFKGGDVIQVTGNNLHSRFSRLFCAFGDQISEKAVVRSSSRIDCQTPKHQPSRVNLSIVQMSSVVSVNESSPVAVVEFEFIGPIVLYSIVPQIGLSRGGTRVTVTGKGFTAHRDLKCRFSDLSTPALFVNSTHVVCISPPRFRKGSNETKLVVMLGSTVSSRMRFMYVNTPFVHAIEPRTGAYNKQHVIQVYGNGFEPEMVILCQFGESSVSVSQGSVISTDLVECALNVSVMKGIQPTLRLPLSLSVDGTDYFDSGFSFELFQPAILIKAIPQTVIPTVTKEITIIYANLTVSGNLECLYIEMNRTAPARILGETRLSCAFPANVSLRPGLLTITLLHDGEQHTFNNLSVDVISIPELFGLNPKSGSVTLMGASSNNRSKPLYVDVTGKNFPPFQGIQCKFGSLLSIGTFQNANSLRCLIPPSPVSKVVPVSVSFNAHDFIESPGSYEFVDTFFIREVVPSNGPVTGGTRVRIRGGSFDPNDNITCLFDSRASSEYAIVVSPSEIECVTPKMKLLGLVKVQIRSEQQRVSGRLRNAFQATKQLVIISVLPRAAFEKRETLFDVYGVGFWRSATLECALQTSQNVTRTDTKNSTVHVFSRAIWISDSHVKCLAPATITAKRDVRVGITNNGVDLVFTDATQAINIFTQFDVTSVYPPFGRFSGGTKVTIQGKHFDTDHQQQVWCGFGKLPKLVIGQFVSADELACYSPRYERSLYGMEPSVNSSGDAVVELALSVNGKDFLPLQQTFTYAHAPRVFMISPTRGDIEGSTLVTVVGEHFRAGMAWCRFGNVEVRAMVVSDTELSCITPRSEHAEEAVRVRVSMNDGVDYSDDSVTYNYHWAPQFRRVSPAFGPPSGDTLLTIQGLNFYNSKFIRCCFGDRSHCSRGWLVTRNQIKCRSPRAVTVIDSASSLLIPLLVTFNGQDFFSVRKDFEYVLEESIEDITPRFADAAGEAVVHLIGRHFRYSSELACRFGNTLAPATFVNESAITCVASANVPGSATVSVTSNGQNFVTSGIEFAFVMIPLIYSVSSASRPLDLNRTILVVGSDFDNTSNIACEFQRRDGSVSRTPAQFLSSERISCDASPITSSGGVDVLVSVNGITSSRENAISFSYSHGPTIHRVEPSLGVVTGGTKLKVLGDGFEPSASLTCCFEQPAANFTRCEGANFVSDIEIQCTTPHFAVAEITTLSVNSNNLAVVATKLAFQVHKPVFLMKISPAHGGYRGETTVQVEGWPFIFTPQLSCCFGDDVRVPATFVNESLLECTTPFYGTRNAIVRVSLNGQDCLNDGDSLTFNFEVPATVKHVIPDMGTQLGGTLVIVDGASFVQNSSVCYFGQMKALFSRVLTPSRMECSAPPQMTASRQRVAVTNNEEDFSTDLVFFSYTEAEVVLAILPDRVSSRRGGMISVSAKNVVNAANLSCFYDEIPVQAIFESTSQVLCSVPRLEPGIKRVYLSNDGVLKSTNYATLEVINPPTIVDVHPTEGFVTGDATVVIEGSRLDVVSHCRFGNTQVIARTLTSNRVECISPPQQVEGVVSLQLVSNGTELLAETLAFTYNNTVNRVVRSLREDRSEDSTDTAALVPVITSIYPQAAPAAGGTHVIVTGLNFQNSNELVCQFGTTSVSARYHSSTQILCVSPRLVPQTYRFQVSSNGEDLSNGQTSIRIYTDAYVQSISPTQGPYTGGTTVTVYGIHFAHTSELKCRFGGESVQVVKFVSPNEVVCVAPAQRGIASVVPVSVTVNNDTVTLNPVFFTYTVMGNVVSVMPQFGPLSGGTIVLVRAYNLEINDGGKVFCRIAGLAVAGELLCSTLLRCVTPRVQSPGEYAVEVSVNGQDYTNSRVMFEYTADIVIERIAPNLGPSLNADTVITVFGSGFLDTVELSCYFDSVRSPALWTSSNEISCAAPRQTPHVASLRVSNNALDKSKMAVHYLYHKDVALSRITPTRGLIVGGTPVFFKGRNFLNGTLMSCRFGEQTVPAQYLSDSMLTCVAPRQLTSLMSTKGVVSVEVSSNRVDFTKSGLTYTYFQRCPIGQHCANTDILPCPNGTICEAHSSGNFSLCPPGTFQPRQAQVACLKCPVGFFCPDFGSTKPVLCRAGMVCDTHGLQVPIKSCPSGHYCRKGTKTANNSDFTANPEYAIDKETQQATFLDTQRAWAFIQRVAPAIGSRRIEHPSLETSCDTRLCVENITVLLAERPYSCPVGMYCKRGVASQHLQPKNFSTPQKCFQGFFCPRGSSTPEGQGPCPTGHYCPTDVDAVVCPAGQFCPGVGNIRPRDCYPGTYNSIVKQSNCTLCPSGYVCPQWKMLAPVLCPAGFVCISTGLSSPALLCPPGYICSLGTRTLDPSDIIPFRPKPCPKGTYCLGGVAHNVTIDWLPNLEAGAVAPQTCTEGTFCKEATRTVSGTAVCFSGHYCPPGSSVPIQAPVGSFSVTTGTVASTLCFPGTYTPLKATVACEVCPAGHSCPGYGTYIPLLCPKGYFRSLADSITCRPCPEGTWTTSTGVTDISLCEICPAGRVCGSSAMSTLSSSLPCAAGYVCGEGTNRRSQFDHLCPGGHYCYSATTIDKQYSNVCEKGYTCMRGTTSTGKNKNKCLDGKFCPLGTANMTSIYIQCPKDTWTGSGQDELLDCMIRPVSICDKLATKQYYPKFSYTFQGSQINFDSTVETERTGEVEVVQIVYPVNQSASVPSWANDTIDAIRTCPPVGGVSGGALLTVIGRNFQDTGRLVCSFQIRDYGHPLKSPAIFVSSTRVRCRVPPYSGDDASDADFFQEVDVQVSNYGVFFSTTAATFTFVSKAVLTALGDMKTLISKCLVMIDEEEGFREDDKAWFAVRGLSKAKLSFDFRHIPADMVYDEHYKIALFVKNSTCESQSCDARGVLKPSGSDIETTPCKLPVELPNWFMSTNVDKHDVLNLTMLALEDVIFKVEIHIMYGLYASTAPFFVNSTSVQIKTPVRSNVTQGVEDADSRPLSRTISYEEALIPRDYTFLIVYFGGDGDYTSAPLNLPPKYQDYERGRVLLSHNVSNSSVHMPLIVDAYADVNPGVAYWVMPFGSTELTHQMILKYRETFQEMYADPTDPTGSQYLFQFDKLLLSYLPFFSNCMEYDSYIPTFDLFESDSCSLPEMTSEQEAYGRNWWRRAFPALPNQDDIRHVGTLDVGQEPTADLCMLDLQCHYEEDLATADVTPRWFEQSQDTALFYILREPATMASYFRGGAYYDELYEAKGSDYFIPVTVDNSASMKLEGDCSSLCFPRSVTLDIAYYQLDDNVKRIIKAQLILANYDRDASTTGYTFSLNLHPLNYYQLVIQFAFERQVYIGLFFVLGSTMTVAAFTFWAVVRVTTFLESPPRFRFYAMFALIAPPPSIGVALASAPIFSVVCCFYVLLNGDKYFTTTSASGYWLLDNIYKHFLDDKIDPDEVAATRKGRIGLAFLAFSLYLIVLGAKIFLPKSIAISEKIIAEKNDDEARERSIWWPTQWKRANMMLTSILLGLFLCLMLEFSFWSSFGDYMFYVIVLTEVVNAAVEHWIEGQLKEALLMAPLVSALTLVGGLMTFGATDFGDFVMGNTLDFGMMLLMRVYSDTAFEAIGEFSTMIFSYVFGKLKAFAMGVLVLFRSFSRSTIATAPEVPLTKEKKAEGKKKLTEEEAKKKKAEAEAAEEEGATVEPIIDFYAGASMDRLALFYQPILILLMMYFREELMLPIIYNIREKDMEIYLWYSLIILFFQLVTEVFVLNVVELFQGWKLYDYLVYCRYRFLQREQRWKGLESNLDECIEENLRTLDQMCFSSQFFMMCTVHITGVVFFVVAIEIMARAEYNLFGDPAMPILLAFVLCCAMFVRRLVMFLAVKLEFWKIKHENTAWLAPPDDDDEFGIPRWDELEKIKGASHEAYLMNQRITSETFRFKFLNYNRSWIVNQLPSILTPRTLRRARPYLLSQFAKILDSLNPQISDDDEEKDGDGRPRFGPVTLSASSRTIIRLWLARARRIQRLKAVVQPLIQQTRKSECEMCLSRRQLQVELAIPIEVLGDKFEAQSLAEEFDVAGWKEFFAKHEKFKTLCLNCVVHLKTTTSDASKRGGRGGSGDGTFDPFANDAYGSVQLNAASYALMQKWYKKAQDRIFGKNGRRRNVVDVSDDEEEAMARHFEWTKRPVTLNASSTALARKWLMSARQSLRESGRLTQLPQDLTAGVMRFGGGVTPIPKPAMKMGAAGGSDAAGKMRRK